MFRARLEVTLLRSGTARRLTALGLNLHQFFLDPLRALARLAAQLRRFGGRFRFRRPRRRGGFDQDQAAFL